MSAGAEGARSAAAPRGVPSPVAARHVFAAAALALLVGAGVASFWAATRNFALADFERTPFAARLLEPIPGDEARVMAARWFASESNRALFQMIGPLQVLCAGAAFLLSHGPAHGAPRGGLLRLLLRVALALSVALAALVPKMVALGREIDFVSRAGGAPAEVQRFMLWHGFYMAGDVLLLLLALALVPLLAFASGARS